MSGFSNPVVNALGDLIRTLMRSANYVAGVAGWQIERDGDAEFNDVVIRGDVVIGGGSPGNPGWLFTESIPAELQTYYGGTLVTVQLGYSNLVNLYNYTGLISNGTIVTGFVFGVTVEEVSRTSRLGGAHYEMQWGFDGANVVDLTIGQNGGAYTGAVASFQGVDVSFSSLSRFRMRAQLFVDGAYSIPGYVPYAPTYDQCNAGFACVVAATVVPNTTRVVAVQDVNDVFMVDGHFDISNAVAPGGSIAIGELQVDGVAQANQALHQASGTPARETTSQSWLVTGLAAGNHTFRLTAKATVAGVYVCNAVHTTMRIDGRYRQ